MYVIDHAYSLGVDFIFIARNDIRICTFWLQVEERVADFAVGRMKRVTDAVERVAQAQRVDIERHSVEKAHRREQQRTHQTPLGTFQHVATL